MTLSDGHRVQHVALSGPPGLPWGEVARRLPAGWPADPTAYAVPSPQGPRRLSPTSRLGDPPLLHGAGLLSGEAVAGRSRPSAPAPAEMVAVEGPDCGRWWPLPAGARLSVGRDPSCRASIQDPALSRRHCTVTATRQGVLVTDLGSTNGAQLDGRLVLDQTRWTPGQRLSVGSSVLELDVAPPLPLRAEADGAGYLVVTPTAPRPAVPPAVALDTPAVPTMSRPTAPPVLAWALPLLVSVGLALVLRMPMLLLFGLMAPAMMLGSHFGERRHRRHEHSRASKRHTEEMTALDDQVRRAVARELRLVRTAHLDVARWCAVVRERPAEPLWSRAAAPGALVLRLGRARLPTSVQLDEQPVPADDAPLLHAWTGTLGIVGPPSLVRALARTLLCQVVLTHDPQTLVIGAVHPDPEWDWLAWAARPAVPGCAQVLLDDRLDRPDDSCAGSATAVLRLARTREELGAVDDLVEVGDPTSACWHACGGTDPVAFCPDLTSRDLARWMLRRVAGWRTPERAGDAGAGVVPRSVPLAAIHPGADDVTAVLRRWEHRPSSTRCRLGLGAAGPVEIDLAVDGPHALVAGTTGAGKSELLRTMVTALALGNRPDQLVFVLVDYKGGSAFTECAQLPHCVGLVTDLDPHLADRALTSLRAELKRRERLLADVGARDLSAYQAKEGMPALPRLVLVIDEYRALAEELPAFVDGLVRIAALGRSLGLHLVLATQRPTGIVSADVRANMNLRIALRLRDTADSYDVLESPEAAALPEGVPGRALLRTGADAPRMLQVARVMDATAGSGPSVSVHV
ncbi:MAG: FHA domain-containing protein, partial [Actinobacteria bacterium]|nr:FHA domain-containing protein [Actinomycetota bacterium]